MGGPRSPTSDDSGYVWAGPRASHATHAGFSSPPHVPGRSSAAGASALTGGRGWPLRVSGLLDAAGLRRLAVVRWSGLPRSDRLPIERLRRDVGAVGPHDCPLGRVDTDLGEETRIVA